MEVFLLAWVLSRWLCWVQSAMQEWPSTPWLYRKTPQPGKAPLNGNHLDQSAARSGRQKYLLFHSHSKWCTLYDKPILLSSFLLFNSTYFIEYVFPVHSSHRDCSKSAGQEVTRAVSSKVAGQGRRSIFRTTLDLCMFMFLTCHLFFVYRGEFPSPVCLSCLSHYHNSETVVRNWTDFQALYKKERPKESKPFLK